MEVTKRANQPQSTFYIFIILLAIQSKMALPYPSLTYKAPTKAPILLIRRLFNYFVH
jgi:hypothetical protein